MLINIIPSYDKIKFPHILTPAVNANILIIINTFVYLMYLTHCYFVLK